MAESVTQIGFRFDWKVLADRSAEALLGTGRSEARLAHKSGLGTKARKLYFFSNRMSGTVFGGLNVEKRSDVKSVRGSSPYGECSPILVGANKMRSSNRS